MPKSTETPAHTADPMIVYIQSKKQFDDLIKKMKVVIVDFWAEWCGPCVSLGKALEKTYIPQMKAHTDKVCIAKCNTDNAEMQTLYHQFDTPDKPDDDGIPRIVVFLNAKCVIFKLKDEKGNKIETNKFVGYESGLPQQLVDLTNNLLTK